MENGVLVIDKSVGPSSFDVVREVRKVTGIKRVGHAGSLDPFATGVLVVLTGKATKLSNALLNADKRYQAVIKLGQSTDSMDCTGKVNAEADVPSFRPDEVKACLDSFRGEWSMVPPMFSAKKIQGVRLYELARKNMVVQRDPILVQLYDLKMISFDGGSLTFEVHCSKGTYIRSLGDEIAKRLGTLGHLSELRRLSCGPFFIEQSLSVEQLKENRADSMGAAYLNYLKLLSVEGVVRTQPVRHSPGVTKEGERSSSFGLSSNKISHLPRTTNNDMSFVN